jgi:hypothetical protein
VLLATGKVEEAERSWLWQDARARRRRVAGAARSPLRGALRGAPPSRSEGSAPDRAALRPGWTELQFQLGEVELQLAEWDAAAAAFEAYVAAEPTGPHASDAKKRLEDLIA